MVAATAAQIREVLAKDPGLMVELKRLMAKQAIEKGQIVAEQDLEDDAILDRLTTDIRFRALATRLLQRYGYLSPELNPLSPSGKEQDLMMRARAERLARAHPEETELSAGLRPSQAECEQDKDNPACVMETSNPSHHGFMAGIGELQKLHANRATRTSPVKLRRTDLCTAILSFPARDAGDRELPPPNIQRPDLTNSTLMTASAVSTTGRWAKDQPRRPAGFGPKSSRM